MWIAPLLALVAQLDLGAAGRVVRGSVTVIAEDGNWLELSSGSLMMTTGGPLRRERLVPFRDGAFELRLDQPTSWIDIYGAWTVLGPARIDAINLFTAEIGELDLRANVVAPFTLRVLDAETATPLDCVDIIPPWCPDELRVELSGVDGNAVAIGPLFCDGLWGRRGEGWWTVRAPGRVEGGVRLTHDSPRSIVVYLEHAGELELVLVNSPSTRHTYVEVESADNGLLFREHGDLGTSRLIEGLKPGPYVARVVHEFLDYRRVVLAETSVEVLPDTVVSARFTVAKSPPDDTDGPWEPLMPE